MKTFSFLRTMLLICFSLNALNAFGATAPAPITASSFGEVSPTPTIAPGTPELEVHILQKNDAGNSYQIGDRIPLYVEVNPDWVVNAPNLHFKLPENTDPNSKSLADQGWYVDPSPQLLGANLRFVISPLQPGTLVLPTLHLLKEDESLLATTKPISFQIQDIKDRSKEKSELLDPLSISLATKYIILFSLLGLALALLVAYLIRRYLKTRRAQKVVAEIPPLRKELAHVVALRAISQLYTELPYATENLKPVSFGISEILKTFFSERFQVDANESTTDEMVALLRAEAVPQDTIREINALFEKLDLVKFTKLPPAQLMNRESYQNFRDEAEKLISKWPQAERERS